MVFDPASVTLLTVDDDAGTLALSAAIFRRARYKVITARNAVEALKALHDNPFIALLFTDIQMPGIDGFMLADMAKVSRPGLKVIYATGLGDEVDTIPGVRHGPIIDKPYPAEQLCDQVRIALTT